VAGLIYCTEPEQTEKPFCRAAKELANELGAELLIFGYTIDFTRSTAG
jgi:hypothetical protein